MIWFPLRVCLLWFTATAEQWLTEELLPLTLVLELLKALWRSKVIFVVLLTAEFSLWLPTKNCFYPQGKAISSLCFQHKITLSLTFFTFFCRQLCLENIVLLCIKQEFTHNKEFSEKHCLYLTYTLWLPLSIFFQMWYKHITHPNKYEKRRFFILNWTRRIRILFFSSFYAVYFSTRYSWCSSL